MIINILSNNILLQFIGASNKKRPLSSDDEDELDVCQPSEVQNGKKSGETSHTCVTATQTSVETTNTRSSA